MGKKKGKNGGGGDGQFNRKWMKTDLYRNIDRYVDQARRDISQDYQKQKSYQESLKTRPKLAFPYLSYLLHERIRADTRNALPNSRQVFSSEAFLQKANVLPYQRILSEKSKEYCEYILSDIIQPEMNSTYNIVDYIDYMKVKKRNYSRNGSGAEVKSLQTLCLQTIAKNCQYYEDEHFAILLNHLTHESIVQLNYYCCFYGYSVLAGEPPLISYEKFCLFARFPLEVIHFPSHLLTQRGTNSCLLEDYLHLLTDNTFQHSFQEQGSEEDTDGERSWEDIDYSLLYFVDRRKYLKHVCFHETSLSITQTTSLLLSELPSLESITFIHAALYGGSSGMQRSFEEDNPSVPKEPDVRSLGKSLKDGICEEFLLSLVSLLPAATPLQSVTLLYCSWVNYSAFRNFLFNYLIHYPLLSPLTISVVCCLENCTLLEIEKSKAHWRQLSEEYSSLSKLTLLTAFTTP